MNVVHLEILTVQVEDINLNVGTGTELGESIIQDVKGVSIVIRRSLWDLLHQILSTEAAIKTEELKGVIASPQEPDQPYTVDHSARLCQFAFNDRWVLLENKVAD